MGPTELDMQDQVEALAGKLDCAVLVEDVCSRPLWWSTQGEVDSVRTRTILQRSAPPAAAALIARMRLSTATHPVRTPALPDDDMAARWCVPVRAGDRLLGYLWVLDARERVSENELTAAVDCAAAAVRTLLRAQPSAEERARRRTTLLRRLTRGPDEEAARGLVDLENLSADVHVAVNAPLTNDGWPLPDGTCVFVQPLEGVTYTSGAAVPLLDLAVAWRRATATHRALRAGARLARPSWDALGAWALIAGAPAELTPGQIHPGADVLLSQNRPELAVTARCVLDNGGEVSTSSAELHIHRSTLYYRLDKIQALTGVNLRTATGRDDLHIALLLAAYRQAG